MKILITNTILVGRSGTEIFVAQLANALRQSGHQVLLYAPRVEDFGLSLRRAGHLVFERIADIPSPPDIIHAHHLGPALTALAAFPKTPAIFISHGVESTFDTMPLHPRIIFHLAVSNFVREQRASSRLPASSILLLRNAVDLNQFPAKPPLPSTPRQALLVAKYPAGIDMIHQTCTRLNLPLTIAGAGIQNTVDNLPALFAQADLVFASGRSALEALAAGCAVILTEGGKFGGLITPTRIQSLLDDNLGVRTLPQQLTPALLDQAIAAYNPTTAAQVTAHVRDTSSLTTQVDQLLALYTEAITRFIPPQNTDIPLATLIESYIPTHGYLPWRTLAADLAQDALRAKLNLLAKIDGATILDDSDPPLTRHQTPTPAELELTKLQNSLSWRLTRPLRWIRRRFG